MKKVIALVLVIAAIIAPVFANAQQEATTQAQTQSRHLVIATTYPNSTGNAAPLNNQKAIYPFMEKLEEISGGKMTCDINIASALGNTAQHYETLYEVVYCRSHVSAENYIYTGKNGHYDNADPVRNVECHTEESGKTVIYR